MKKALTILSVAFFAFALSSCEKCATCTTTEDDPNATSTVRETEICGNGREYTDQVTIYERTNWTCTEN
jgi:hypothetical protein